MRQLQSHRSKLLAVNLKQANCKNLDTLRRYDLMDFRSPVSTVVRFGPATDGLFSDKFDIHFVGAVLGQLIALGFSDLAQNATFISATFVSILIGAIGAADRCGRAD
ncbi:hypothetical protein [Bradyrhizobium arachidis]|uniref:Uncharacterized protein n=1 Tax=Bradyrhizobium arachidis TaxID=858423 RepID=A0AAE7NX24_9BRAD|nr:hypothetical protein [Bradyrhizobium arachidis]QOZ71055.1 hypothetical protein WN72_35660 [Bradyrhizobium arachidis]SFV17840.1 hypothetical protein SAMN05192541_13083 [Bradyrhizobium arachidis]